jgi:glycosyltransferase involved in cell wall biosynthesis
MGDAKSKIAIISYSLGGGGAERFAGSLGFMLDGLGYDIHNIIINDSVSFPYVGKLFNLGKEVQGRNPINRKIGKSLLLRKYLRTNCIDVIIDSRPRNAVIRDFVGKIIFGSRKSYYIIHSYKTDNYLPSSIFLARLLYADAERLICVSKAIEEKLKSIYGFKNTVTIYNPAPDIIETIGNNLPISGKYLLYFGRFDEKVKNFSLLLEAFSQSRIFQWGYKLVLMGDGPDEGFIRNGIRSYGLTDYVEILPFENEPFSYVKNARFTVLTSHFEGFPMSLVESLALGTPVVSVDCASGPSEIINDRYNGLLVPNHRSDLLASAMRELAEDSNLYDICKNNAQASIAHLSSQNISKQWQQILP